MLRLILDYQSQQGFVAVFFNDMPSTYRIYVFPRTSALIDSHVSIGREMDFRLRLALKQMAKFVR